MQSTEPPALTGPTEETPTAPLPHRWKVPKLSTIEWIFLAGIGLGALAVGGLGLYMSYDNVTQHMRDKGFEHPSLVPISVDIAIPVFSLAYLLLIRMNMPLAWPRWLAWVLTYVTIHLNVTSTTELDAQIAHATLPALWIAFTEVVAHAYRAWIGKTNGTRTDPIPLVNWFLSPFSTAHLWRHMKLWEITSYTQALELKRERLRARAALTRIYGKGWRRDAPLELRFELRLGQLTAFDVYEVHRNNDDPECLVDRGVRRSLAPAPEQRELANADEQTALPIGTQTASASPEGDQPYAVASDLSEGSYGPLEHDNNDSAGLQLAYSAPQPLAQHATTVADVAQVETKSEREQREFQEQQEQRAQDQMKNDRNDVILTVIQELVANREPISGPRIAEDDRVSVGARTVQRTIKKLKADGLIPEDIDG
ncbi:DUF2637 domain-containing protein [Streptomyces sp. NPDC051644]|uniref:DUF2637 domain-containing protein n=1 Tax=Streptomyces sp. NPDC051644 TaxID=3365666 RepID=UPI0037A991C3